MTRLLIPEPKPFWNQPLQALLKIELPEDPSSAQVPTAAEPMKLESLASPQKARRKVTWTESVDLCKDDPYVTASVPECTAVDSALHRLGTDDIEDCVAETKNYLGFIHPKGPANLICLQEMAKRNPQTVPTAKPLAAEAALLQW